LKVINDTPFTEENGYKNGFEDLLRFQRVANKYFKNDKVATLENPMQLYEDYSKIDWFMPLMIYGKVLFNYMNAVKINFFSVTNFKIPLYFFAGRYDYNTSSVIVEQYFKTIKAPVKKLYWFEQSGHSPHWEEATLFHQRVLQIADDNKIK
jgi:pimeloyl-ACP methyl ester carboxylesterase